MKRLIINILNIFVFSFLIGCVDENIVPNSGNVGVHLYDINAFPGNNNGCQLIVGQKLIPLIDKDGGAYFNNLQHPYIINANYWVEDEFGIYIFNHLFFSNVQNDNCNIVLFNTYVFNQYNYCPVFVKFPTVPDGKHGILKFISKENFSKDTVGFIEPGWEIYEYYVKFPKNKNSISGKFVYIEATWDYEKGQFLSFDKYGEKNVVLNPLSNGNVVFSPEDINYNPGEENFSYQIITNSSDPSQTDVYLTFDDYNFASDMKIFERIESIPDKANIIVIPDALPTKFKIKLYNASYYPYPYNNHYHEKWMSSEPGAGIILDNSVTPILLSPADNSHNISDSTSFRFSSNSDEGLYGVYFDYFTMYGGYRQCYITMKNDVTFGELKKAGLIFPDHKEWIQWWVEKFSDFSSIDEFLSMPYILNPKFNSRIDSDGRGFYYP